MVCAATGVVDALLLGKETVRDIVGASKQEGGFIVFTAIGLVAALVCVWCWSNRSTIARFVGSGSEKEAARLTWGERKKKVGTESKGR